MSSSPSRAALIVAVVMVSPLLVRMHSPGPRPAAAAMKSSAAGTSRPASRDMSRSVKRASCAVLAAAFRWAGDCSPPGPGAGPGSRSPRANAA